MSITKALLFLKQPELKAPVAFSFKQLAMIFLQSFLVYFIILLICSIFFIPLSLFGKLPEIPKHQQSDMIWILLYAPILEELHYATLPTRCFCLLYFFLI
jgi:hypothetical protein